MNAPRPIDPASDPASARKPLSDPGDLAADGIPPSKSPVAEPDDEDDGYEPV
jgi:hypothetical protein